MCSWLLEANIIVVLKLLIIFCLLSIFIEDRFMDSINDAPSGGANFTRCQGNHLPSSGIMVDLLVHAKQT